MRSKLWALVLLGCLIGSSQHQALANASTYIANGNTAQVYGPTDWGTLCKQVTNNSGKTIFVPANISLEWADFNATPGPGVTLADCDTYSAVNLNYSSCSAPCGGGTCTQNLVSWDCQQNDRTKSITSIVSHSYCSPPAQTQNYTNNDACPLPQDGQCGSASWTCNVGGAVGGWSDGYNNYWTCNGINGGNSNQCLAGAAQDGQCGSASWTCNVGGAANGWSDANNNYWT